MAQRFAFHIDPLGRHRVELDRSVGFLEGPRRVVDLGPVELPFVLGVQAVALGQELLDRYICSSEAM